MDNMHCHTHKLKHPEIKAFAMHHLLVSVLILQKKNNAQTSLRNH